MPVVCPYVNAVLEHFPNASQRKYSIRIHVAQRAAVELQAANVHAAKVQYTRRSLLTVCCGNSNGNSPPRDESTVGLCKGTQTAAEFQTERVHAAGECTVYAAHRLRRDSTETANIHAAK